MVLGGSVWERDGTRSATANTPTPSRFRPETEFLSAAAAAKPHRETGSQCPGTSGRVMGPPALIGCCFDPPTRCSLFQPRVRAVTTALQHGGPGGAGLRTHGARSPAPAGTGRAEEPAGVGVGRRPSEPPLISARPSPTWAGRGPR